MALMSLVGQCNTKLLNRLRPGVIHAFGGSSANKSTGTAQEQIDNFWRKNKKLNRPMSPHMTVYKLADITSGLSLTHRATGMLLAGATTSFAFATPLLPANLDQAIYGLQTYMDTWLGYLVVMDVKFLLVWCIMFHTCNGIRHLAWDTGKGFQMDDLKKSGYAVIGLSALLATLIVYFCK